MATTDTKPRTGVMSSTTVDICNGGGADGNERQDEALLIASRWPRARLHGRKPNRAAQVARSATEQPRDDDQHHEDRKHQGHPRLWQRAHYSSPGSRCRIRRSSLMPCPSALSSSTAMPNASASTTGITITVWATNPSPDSHSSTPSHQLRKPVTGSG